MGGCGQNGCGILLGNWTLKTTASQEWIDVKSWFLHADTNWRRLKVLQIGFPNVFNKSLIKCENWKWPETLVFILHGYQTQQTQNFAIPPLWLPYPTISKHCFHCLTFSLHNFKISPTFHITIEFFQIHT